MPKFNGFDHLEQHEITNHNDNIFTKTVNSILRIPITITIDGYEQSMDKFLNFNASYNCYSPKSKMECRKSMTFTLYVHK